VRGPPPLRGLPPNRLRRGRQGRRVSRLATGVTLLALVAVTAGFAAFAVWSYSVIRGFPEDRGQAVSSLKPVQIVGRDQTVFDWSADACEPRDIPDSAARAFRDAAGNVNLIATHYVNRRAIGRSLGSVQHRCQVILRSGYRPNPAAFNDRVWLTAPYTPDGRNVYALLHDEYQGYNHPGRCLTGSMHRCWYNTITFSRSSDGGASYSESGASRFVAGIPYRYAPDRGRTGLFQPSNIVRNPRDGYYYAMIVAQSYKRQRRGVCVIRTSRLDQPGSWRAWNGEDFTVRFADPYSSSRASAASHICAPVSVNEIGEMSQSLTYNTYLGKFMLVSAASGRRKGRTVKGFFYSVSDDLIHWEPRQLIREERLIQDHRCGGPKLAYYPSIIDPRSPSRNFETVGRSAYLYFTRFNMSGCERGYDRDLVRVRVRFSK
jgi:hypothetical protein